MPLESLDILGESIFRSIYFSMTYKNNEKKENKREEKEGKEIKACNIFPCQPSDLPCIIFTLE